jgi:transcription initiation factor TFIIIB Brf1 subunit/transcription initiation factor TFIIB
MTDQQYPIGGFAPGNYFSKCRTCGNQFQGDKRSFQCEPCAIKDKEFYDGLTPEQKERFDKSHDEIVKLFFENLTLKEEKKKHAIEFAEWANINAIRCGPHKWVHKHDNYKERVTSEQLYDIFNPPKP